MFFGQNSDVPREQNAGAAKGLRQRSMQRCHEVLRWTTPMVRHLRFVSSGAALPSPAGFHHISI